MSEIQEEIDRCLKDGTLTEAVKNTIVGMLNTDPEYHHEMAVFCLQGIDSLKADIEKRHNQSLLYLNEIDETECSKGVWDAVVKFESPLGLYIEKETVFEIISAMSENNNQAIAEAEEAMRAKCIEVLREELPWLDKPVLDSVCLSMSYASKDESLNRIDCEGVGDNDGFFEIEAGNE